MTGSSQFNECIGLQLLAHLAERLAVMLRKTLLLFAIVVAIFLVLIMLNYKNNEPNGSAIENDAQLAFVSEMYVCDSALRVGINQDDSRFAIECRSDSIEFWKFHAQRPEFHYEYPARNIGLLV